MIDESEVRKRYNEIDCIWDPSDAWHTYTHKKINKVLRDIENTYIPSGGTVLFAGSAGNSYSIKSATEFHLDVAENTLKGVENAVVGSIQNMPFQSNSVDCIVCVGSVVNYVDLTMAIIEFQRVLKPQGVLILEFEKSDSFEYIYTKHFKKNISLVETFYNNGAERIWVYSYRHFIKEIKQANFKIKYENHFHIASSLMLRLSKNSNFSSKLSCLDVFLSRTPIIKYFSCNSLFVLSKNAFNEL